MQFNSKYSIGDLLEFKSGGNDPENKIGFVTGVRFRKTDAVSYIADYEITLVNDPVEAKTYVIVEHDIIRQFISSTK